MRKTLQDAEDGKLFWPLQWVYNVLLAISQLASAILGGDPDESISGRTGKASLAGKLWFVKFQEPVINWIFLDPISDKSEGHCRKSIEKDEGKKQIWNWSA